MTEEEITDILGERDSNPFGDLLTEVLDELMYDPSPYVIAFFVNTLCSPNGTQMVDSKLIRYPKSIDGILLPLILHNYFSNYDIDFLVHLIDTFNKSQSLQPHLKRYKELRQLGQPYVRKVRNSHQNLMIRCLCSNDHPSINWITVSQVKNKLREVFELTDFPYLMHFIGWSINPISLCYQLPLACLSSIRVIMDNYPTTLVQAKIIKVVIEIGSAKFVYDSV